MDPSTETLSVAPMPSVDESADGGSSGSVDRDAVSDNDAVELTSLAAAAPLVDLSTETAAVVWLQSHRHVQRRLRWRICRERRRQWHRSGPGDESADRGSGGSVDRDAIHGTDAVEVTSAAVTAAVDLSTEMAAVVWLQSHRHVQRRLRWSICRPRRRQWHRCSRSAESDDRCSSGSVDRDAVSGTDAVG